MASRPSDERPTAPWKPAKLRVHNVYTRTLTPKRGANAGRTIKVYDVRFSVDGFPFSRTFERKGHADGFGERLVIEHAAQRLFDPVTREYIEPAAMVVAPTVVAFTAEHFARQWPSWSPANRRNRQRELAVACVYLVRDDAPVLAGRERVTADTYLRCAVLISPVVEPPEPLDGSDGWEAWFARWSLPMPDVTPTHLHRYLDTIRVQALDGRRRTIGALTIERYRVAIKAVFRAATAQRVIDWNPWEGVAWSLPEGEEDLDPDLVMNQRQVHRLARTCGGLRGESRAFVLIQGVCGLRPSEAREVRRRDLDLESVPATVTVRASRTDVPKRFLDPGESRRRPLKGRGRKARRVVPIPRHLVPILREHLDRYVAASPDALVFPSPTGRPLSLTDFHRAVWHRARTTTFPAGNRLRSVRRHDLRHAAITNWLNSGVTLKTCQRWSGHRRASVLLDTYLGVTVDDAALSIRRVEEALDAVYGNEQGTGEGRVSSQPDRNEGDGHGAGEVDRGER